MKALCFATVIALSPAAIRPLAQEPPQLTIRCRVLDERGEPLAGVGAVFGLIEHITSDAALTAPTATTGPDGHLMLRAQQAQLQQ